MGFGDSIMASGHALTEHKRTGKRVQICNIHWDPYWDELWNDLPWVARPGEPGEHARIQNASGCRPYITYPFTLQSGCTYSGWRARDHPGQIILTDQEIRWAVDKIPLHAFYLIEPNVKSNPNKQWGWDRWQQLVDLLHPAPVLQMAYPDARILPNTIQVFTPTFRHAVALMTMARVRVLPEGSLHHAAACWQLPTVTLFGGATSIDATGYPSQTNIGNGPACGKWLPCDHCREIWFHLSPEVVAKHARDLW